jgi:hypothetical protein
MAADQVDKTIQLLWIGCSNCRKEVIEELLLRFQRLYLAVDGYFAPFVVLVVLDAFCSVG